MDVTIWIRQKKEDEDEGNTIKIISHLCTHSGGRKAFNSSCTRVKKLKRALIWLSAVTRVVWICWWWCRQRNTLSSFLTRTPSDFPLPSTLPRFLRKSRQECVSWMNRSLYSVIKDTKLRLDSPPQTLTHQTSSVRSGPCHNTLIMHYFSPFFTRTHKLLSCLAKFLCSFWRPSLQPSSVSHRELVPFEDALSSAPWQAHYRAGGGEIAPLPTGTSWGKSNEHYSQAYQFLWLNNKYACW